LPVHAEVPFEFLENRQVPQKYGFFIPKPDYAHVIFHVAGFYSEDCNIKGMVEGWLSTNSTNPESIAIFKDIKKIIRKKWRLLGVAYFGPNAWEFMSQGGTVGQDLRNPIQYKSLLDSAGQK
jgi:hypothetical protein